MTVPIAPDSRLSRRQLLASTAAVGTVTFGGCTRLSEFVADSTTGDLNIFNTVDTQIDASVNLTDPDGSTLLSEQFNLRPDGTGDQEPTKIFHDLLTTAGTHQFVVTAESDEQADQYEGTLDITAPNEEKIVVFLGGRLTGEFLTVRVVEDFAELESEFENF
jgi:hypothetical protein